MSKTEKFIALQVAVLTVSDTRTEASDTSGQYLVEQLQAAGHQLGAREIVIDDPYLIRAKVSAWIADPELHAVITTGGAGQVGAVVLDDVVRHMHFGAKINVIEVQTARIAAGDLGAGDTGPVADDLVAVEI